MCYNHIVKPSVYIETSVVSAYSDMREDPVSKAQQLCTFEWWSCQRQYFDLYCSQAVVVELNKIDFPGRDTALKMLDEMTLLPITPQIYGVAEVYQRHLVMPRESIGDAVHLAVACTHEVDYLLTWNCRHLANTNKVEHIQVINQRLGLLTPVLLTPEMLVHGDE